MTYRKNNNKGKMWGTSQSWDKDLVNSNLSQFWFDFLVIM